MKIKPLPDTETLRSLLDYDAETGLLTWKIRPEPSGHDARFVRAWNAKNAGKIAGSVGGNGYIHIRIMDVQFYAHRLIWKIVNGSDPFIIDHQDGDTLNNGFSNLRNTCHVGNHRNSTLQSNNSSGKTGISRTKGGKWRAYLRKNGRQVHIGNFDSKSEAIEARELANQKIGFHPNHGRLK